MQGSALAVGRVSTPTMPATRPPVALPLLARRAAAPAALMAILAAAFACFTWGSGDLSAWERAHRSAVQGMRETAERIAADPSVCERGPDEDEAEHATRLRMFSAVCNELGVRPPASARVE